MVNKGMCATCATRQDLDSDGNVKYHEQTVLKAGGRRKVRCPGTGRKPLT